ncbi:DUF5684 domain-containing protein [Amycolatopsis anabasis]|uniref:DUF5684 domain-containing protein n=1 Tax=Amycolatopsis anabasis TaxID=1840409 RepID=UPI00131AD484|nr:DUF5684 domain-containing protein [Amycolatopsis anabasis]
MDIDTTTALISLALAVPAIAGMWKMFGKAGRPGWAAIIPIYDLYVLLKIAGRSGWWIILFLIPLVNIVVGIIVSVNVAKSYGKGASFGFFGLFLFGFIGYPILGFGGAQYQGPAAAAPRQVAAV